jgi:hypothetical protein
MTGNELHHNKERTIQCLMQRTTSGCTLSLLLCRGLGGLPLTLGVLNNTRCRNCHVWYLQCLEYAVGKQLLYNV